MIIFFMMMYLLHLHPRLCLVTSLCAISSVFDVAFAVFFNYL